MENQPFCRYLPRKMVISMAYQKVYTFSTAQKQMHPRHGQFLQSRCRTHGAVGSLKCQLKTWICFCLVIFFTDCTMGFITIKPTTIWIYVWNSCWENMFGKSPCLGILAHLVRGWGCPITETKRIVFMFHETILSFGDWIPTVDG